MRTIKRRPPVFIFLFEQDGVIRYRAARSETGTRPRAWGWSPEEAIGRLEAIEAARAASSFKEAVKRIGGCAKERCGDWLRKFHRTPASIRH